MVAQLWMSGVVLAFLSFGIKTGTGLAAQIYDPRVSRAGKIVFFLSAFLIFLLLFALLYWAVARLDLLAYLDRISGLIQYGMVLHLAVALGLLVWGWNLLLAQGRVGHAPMKPELTKSVRVGSAQTRAGLFLVFPCPVCATVILMNLTLALSLSELSPLKTAALLFGLFWGIAGITVALLSLFRKKEGLDPGFLGAAMMLIALYFLATILLAPIIPKIRPAYAMALSNSPASSLDPVAALTLAGLALALSTLGFVRRFFKKGDVL